MQTVSQDLEWLRKGQLKRLYQQLERQARAWSDPARKRRLWLREWLATLGQRA